MSWVLAPVLLPLITAILILLGHRQPGFTKVIHGLGALGYLALLPTLFQLVESESVAVLFVGGWIAPFGITMALDYLALVMLAFTGLIHFVVTLWQVVDRNPAQPLMLFAHQALVAGVSGAFVAGDLFNFYVWFEVLLISSFVMLVFEGSRSQLEGGFKYAILNLVASLIFLSACGLIYFQFGTLNLAHLSWLVAEQGDVRSLAQNLSLGFLFVAFGAKAGIFPIYAWMPASYHTCRPEVAALFAGLLTKVGVYAILRYFTLVDPSVLEWAKEPLIWIAGLSMVIGVLGAASSYHIKRILAFHSVSQIGYIILGVVLATTSSIAAALFYTVHHMMVKSGLFLVGGVVEKIKGTVDLKAHGGLLKKSPLLAVVFLVLALSLAGLPVFSGFFAKFTLVRASFLAESYWAGGIALAVGFFTLYSMMKIWLEGFWKDQPQRAVIDQKPGFVIFLPILVLAFATLVIGLQPQWVFDFCQKAAEQLASPELYREKVLTAARAAGFLI